MRARVHLVGGLRGIGDWNRIEIALETREIRRGQLAVNFPNLEFRIASVLLCAAAQDRCLVVSELVEALYGERADGGPESAVDCVRRHIHFARKRFAPIGIVIPVEYTRGYRAEILANPILLPLRHVFVPQRQPVRAFRSLIEQTYYAVFDGRCEEALTLLEQAYPGYRLADLDLKKVAA
jgi:hypothetical protein